MSETPTPQPNKKTPTDPVAEHFKILRPDRFIADQVDLKILPTTRPAEPPRQTDGA